MELLEKTIRGLHRSLEGTRAGGLDVQLSLLVIDNSSLADYRENLERELEECWRGLFDEIRYLYSGANLGYGAAHNLGILSATSDYHLVLNPDVELSCEALELCLGFLQGQPDVVMVNPSAVNGEGVSQGLCKRYPSVLVLMLRAMASPWLNGYMHEYELRGVGGDNQIKEAPLMSGCCMCARTAALQEVGGFCETFFMYFEDFDLSLRLLPLGRLVLLPGMRIVHYGGHSARKGIRHVLLFVHSGWKFFNRHGWSWI